VAFPTGHENCKGWNTTTYREEEGKKKKNMGAANWDEIYVNIYLTNGL
jgi:hypothetical protein